MSPIKTCITCKVRKKGCDKQLPACGYCTTMIIRPQADKSPCFQRRHLVCQYNDNLSKPTPSLPPMQTRPTDEENLRLQVHQIMQTTGRTTDDVIHRYFQSSHVWLPFISERRFLDQIATPMHSDLSILLLSMCLLTYDPLDPRTPPKSVDRESLYLATKMLFAQVQTFLPASPTLIQANVLLCLYEFSRGLLRSAYISIGFCARMAYSIGIHNYKGASKSQNDIESKSEVEENRSLWWAIIICERIILLELVPSDQPLASVSPSADDLLPPDLDFLGLDESATYNQSLSPCLNRVGPFGRLAQAVYLVEKLLNALKIVDITDLQTALSSLDFELQRFLDLVMGSVDQSSPFCGSIGVTVRALFVLHSHVLSLDPITKELKEWQKTSKVALDTLMKIMIDVAHFHYTKDIHPSIKSLSPTSLYTFRVSLKHLRRDGAEHDDVWKWNFEALSRIIHDFQRRWGNEYVMS